MSMLWLLDLVRRNVRRRIGYDRLMNTVIANGFLNEESVAQITANMSATQQMRSAAVAEHWRRVRKHGTEN